MDHQFTRQMQEWLNSKHESDAEIIKGADMLFRLNRNRFYHVRATRQPQAYRTNIEYELNKFLKIRLDNMTIEEVRKMNDIVIPEAQAIIAEEEAEKIGENERISENNGENQGNRRKTAIPLRKMPLPMIQNSRPRIAMEWLLSVRASAWITISCPRK